MEVRYCSSCGQSISATARFCTNCGRPIVEQAEQQDAQGQVYEQREQQKLIPQREAYQQHDHEQQIFQERSFPQQDYQQQSYRQQPYQRPDDPQPGDQQRPYQQPEDCQQPHHQPGYQQRDYQQPGYQQQAYEQPQAYQQQAYSQQAYPQQVYQQQAYQTPAWQHPQSNPYDTPEAEWLWLYSHSDRYVEKWIKNSKWNWASFLFFPFWAGYRKMYAECAIYTAILVGLVFIELLLGLPLKGAYIGIYILCGTLGNKLYYQKAQKEIDHILALHGDYELRRSLIYEKGGTSGWGIVYGIGMFLIGTIIGLLLEEGFYY
nr:DUF2628 domain-containing protein [Paenibacillus sp. 79R4]